MEPREPEKPLESRGEGQTSPPRPEERKRRFRIVKLEERIAPTGGDTKFRACYTCLGTGPCHDKTI
jgi:hypothetical protein